MDNTTNLATEDAFSGYNRLSQARDLLPISKHSI